MYVLAHARLALLYRYSVSKQLNKRWYGIEYGTYHESLSCKERSPELNCKSPDGGPKAGSGKWFLHFMKHV